jgi:hypothetical protein
LERAAAASCRRGGKALLGHALAQDWVRRRKDGRALDITAAGHRGFAAAFGVAPAAYRS